MNRYEELMHKANILKQAANRCLLRGSDWMAKIWMAKADSLKAQALELEMREVV